MKTLSLVIALCIALTISHSSFSQTIQTPAKVRIIITTSVGIDGGTIYKSITETTTIDSTEVRYKDDVCIEKEPFERINTQKLLTPIIWEIENWEISFTRLFLRDNIQYDSISIAIKNQIRCMAAGACMTKFDRFKNVEIRKIHRGRTNSGRLLYKLFGGKRFKAHHKNIKGYEDIIEVFNNGWEKQSRKGINWLDTYITYRKFPEYKVYKKAQESAAIECGNEMTELFFQYIDGKGDEIIELIRKSGKGGKED